MGGLCCSDKLSVRTKEKQNQSVWIKAEENKTTPPNIIPFQKNEGLNGKQEEIKMDLSTTSILYNVKSHFNDNKGMNYKQPDSHLLSLNKPHFTKNEFIKGKLIGKGRFGSVYSGLSANSGEIVAIKIIDTYDKHKLPLLNEGISKLKEIVHDNFINCIPTIDEDVPNSVSSSFSVETGRVGNIPPVTIIYEFCNGNSIKSLLEKYGKFDEKLIKFYLRQTIEGLIYLHTSGYVHCNLTSSNILVDGNGTIRISDVMIDSILLGDGNDIYTRLFKDKLNLSFYISPYFVQDPEHKITFDLDYWSLGCLVLEMSTQKSPWHHYTFKTNEEYVNFLSSTHITPLIPKKLSKNCHNLLNLLFAPHNNKNIYKDLIEHEFFSTNAESIDKPILTHETNRKLSNHGENPDDLNKMVNILNSDGNATFTVSVTVNTQEQFNSVNSAANNNVAVGGIRTQISNQILEELDPRKESSPGAQRNQVNYFDFNSESENSYNYVHLANQSIKPSTVVNSLPIDTINSTKKQLQGRFNNLEIALTQEHKSDDEDKSNKDNDELNYSEIQPINEIKGDIQDNNVIHINISNSNTFN